jgi:SAM-dependent methyltransferase
VISQPRYQKREILRNFAQHPLRRDTILARLRASGRGLRNLTALDLANDPASEITDQNHIGGCAAVADLARFAAIDRSCRVLELGCGLGGAARVLAHLTGCQVLGLDFSPQRCAEAIQLNRLVRLQRRVKIECADLRTAPVPPACYDILWGQAAWSHLRDKSGFLRRWAKALRPGARIAFEDACLFPSRAGRLKLARLEDIWTCHLVPAEIWARLFSDLGFEPALQEDRTAEMLAYFRKLKASDQHASSATVAEQQAWSWAVELCEAGILRYVRIVAIDRRVPQPPALHSPTASASPA